MCSIAIHLAVFVAGVAKAGSSRSIARRLGIEPLCEDALHIPARGALFTHQHVTL